ncbi:hypothetical protein E3N88_18034 [Mikania micrantha]|uniref:Uncharacterized protein n=1 Tax=Mikania micrantha TaxID=192012 RepID=A0A5N6NW97_9ASTR|nr:hypothetical protein E3N88_18034 [Mikania micrantha]
MSNDLRSWFVTFPNGMIPLVENWGCDIRCPRAFEQSTHPSWHPDVSTIGRGVTDWYQSLGYRELGY